jgi:hypothetical protein
MIGSVFDFTGWRCTVLSTGDGETSGANIELEQLDADGHDWFADGPGGTECGSLAVALRAAAGGSADSGWVAAVIAAIERPLAAHQRGSPVLVIRGRGTWYHATASRNRDSIRRHGLDWTRMTPPGIAGSQGPETAGIFLCRELDSAEWFAGMCRDGAADIWTVRLNHVWLESAPSGGGDGDWMICPEPIPPSQITLQRTEIPRRM